MTSKGWISFKDFGVMGEQINRLFRNMDKNRLETIQLGNFEENLVQFTKLN
jgi:hypothetical protein